MRGATNKPVRFCPHCGNFNPRSPCGERHERRGYAQFLLSISIHAPHAGSDNPPVLPTPRDLQISIHAPHAGSDFKVHHSQGGIIAYFNPRSPCGERPDSKCYRYLIRYFNPRSPCGERRSASPLFPLIQSYFNPRSPCGERQRHFLGGSAYWYFNPRSPCGERL